VFLLLFSAAYCPAQPMLQNTSAVISVEYDPTAPGEAQTTGLSLMLDVLNNELVPYRLAVSMDAPFSQDGISLRLRPEFDLFEEGEPVDMDPFEANEGFVPPAIERVFYRNTEPTLEMQSIPLKLDILVPQGLSAGIYSASLRFVLLEYETLDMDETDPFDDPFANDPTAIPGMPLSEITVTVEIRIPEILELRVTIEDSSETDAGNPPTSPDATSGRDETPILDFGFIDPDEPFQDKLVTVEVVTNLARPYRLYQRRGEDMLSDEHNFAFPDRVIVFEIDDTEIRGRAAHDEPQPLLSGEQDMLLYESDAEGSPDSIPIYFTLKDLERVFAGRYTSTLSFFIEPVSRSTSLPRTQVTFILQIEIKKKFFFELAPIEGGFNLDFTPEIRDAGFVDRILKVAIVSNLGLPYTFSHSIETALMNEHGAHFAEEDLSYRLAGEDELASLEGIPNDTLNPVDDASSPTPNTASTVDLYDFQPLKQNETPVYRSDEEGSPAVFYLKYRMRLRKQQLAGFYQSQLNYKLSTE
jgi:hypothetical protein